MRRLPVVLLLIAFLPGGVLKTQESGKLILNLTQCEKIALENSPFIDDARLTLDRSKARHTQANHARFVPGLDVRNIWGPIPQRSGLYNDGILVSPDTSFKFSNLSFFTDIELNIVQPLFTFGKLTGMSRAAYNGVLADEANLERTENEVQLKTRELYWGLLMGKELLIIAEKAGKEVKGAEDKVRNLLDEDSEEVNQTDLFKLELFKYEIKKRHREAIVKFETAQSGLRILLDLDDSIDWDLESDTIDAIDFVRDSLDVYYTIALGRRPEVAQLQAGIQARRALMTVANSDYYPQFFVGGQIKFNYARNVFDPNNPFVYNPTNFFRPGIVIGFKWNLNFVQVRDRSRLAYVEFRQMQQKESLLLSSIKLEVQTAYMQLEQAEVNIRDSDIALRAGRNWLRSETMKWDIGSGEVKDLIDAYKANATMETEHLQNVFKFNVAVARLGKAIGRDLYTNLNLGE